MELHVAADDRTGAFETAGALADHGIGPISVTVWGHGHRAGPPGSTGRVTVVDLGSRHLSPPSAADRAAALVTTGRSAHKIDSALRGNWAEELVARSEATDKAVLLVPALPAAGRTCVDGVVLEHGRPVHEGAAGTDVRRRVKTARPADTLRAAGAIGAVIELDGVDGLADWLEKPGGFAVVDASTDAQIERIVGAWWDHPDVLLAGTAAVIGAAGAHLAHDAVADDSVVAHRTGVADGPGVADGAEHGEPDHGAGPDSAVGGPGRFGEPVLVACGSLHPMARAQLDDAERRGLPIATIVDEITIRTLNDAGRLALVTEIPPGDIDAPFAIAAASALARGVHDIMHAVALGALVLIGGDTAAAVLGDTDVVVHRSVAPGTPLVTVPGVDVPVITRSGGFGSEHALVELLEGLRTGSLHP